MGARQPYKYRDVLGIGHASLLLSQCLLLFQHLLSPIAQHLAFFTSPESIISRRRDSTRSVCSPLAGPPDVTARAQSGPAWAQLGIVGA